MTAALFLFIIDDDWSEITDIRRLKMKLDTYELRRTSALFWFTLVISIGIIGVGINFILNPVGASAAYGVAITDPGSFPFMWIKGIRDIFSGLVILPFLLNGNRRVTAILFAISI